MPRPRVKVPTITATGAVMGRPRKNPPPDAKEIIEKLAANGIGVLGVARYMKVSADTIRNWFDEDAALRESYDFGRELERHHLHTLLRKQADQGNVIATLFLLKSRHGYTEGEKPEAAARVNISFTMPAAIPLARYTVENERTKTD